jgi:signal transduction histidine kinase
VAKVEAGAAQLERAPVDLGALARRAVEGFRTAAEARSIKLGVVAPEPMAALLLDAGWIESALTNLVANAMKAIDAGGRVTVRIVDRGDSVRLEVEDDGPGIAPDLLERLFERFAQGSGERRRGSGLGLALVREAARLHGGEAAATSEQGKGALFVLTLPRIVAEKPRTRTIPPEPATAFPAPEVGLLAAPPQTVEADRAGPSPDAPLALVVEDNPDLRRFLADVLAVQYRVKLASDGPGGLALALAHHPDVIVLDIGLPGMSGLDVTRALRKDEATRTTPVVLVTARAGLGQVLEGFDAGADDYLVKPFHGRELLARVGVHVRLRRVLERAAHRDRLANLGVLAASVAHNVRNPLTSLVSGLPAMQKRLGDRLDEPSREMMDVMIECAERIERMTIDLLDLSRIDREPQGEFRPGTGLMAAVRLVSSRLPASIRVSTNVDEDAVLLARPGDVNHVFLNLIDNAARSVGESGEIKVEGALRDGRYVVTVADSGPGVDPALGERIFEPFVTTRPAGEGTGLGLAIARDVVRNHGGTIGFGPSELGGALFTVAIPSLAGASARSVEVGAKAERPAARSLGGRG